MERAGDFRSGVLLDITANCSVKLVGTNVKVSNVPGSILTPWNVRFHLKYQHFSLIGRYVLCRCELSIIELLFIFQFSIRCVSSPINF